MNALVFLWHCRIGNAVRRGLRNPRVAVPGLLLTAGVCVQFVLFFLAERGAAGTAPVFSSNDLLMGRPAAFLLTMRCLLLLSVFTGLIASLGEGAAFFDRSDIDFLFTAPLPRRFVLLWKMTGRYASLTVPAIYLPITFAGGYFADVAVHWVLFLPGMIGAWLFLVMIANFTQLLLLRSTVTPDDTVDRDRRRRRWRYGLTACFTGMMVWVMVRGGSASDLVRRSRDLSQSLDGAVPWTRLTPDAWAADLFQIPFEGPEGGDGWRFVGLLIFCGVSFIALFGRERDFYESSMEIAVRKAQVKEAVRNGDVGSVLSTMAKEGQLARGRSFPHFGGGARAILWKDLVAATRIPLRNWLQLLIPAAFPALLGGMFGRENGLNVLGWTLLYGIQMPGIFLMTLRDVVRRADLSKSLPISPIRLLGAELLLPLLQLTVLGWISLGAVWVAGVWRGPLLQAAALILPSLAALLFLVQAIFVLVYPNPTDPAQNAVSGVVSLGISLAALIPALSVGIVLFLLGVPVLVLAVAITAVNLIGATAALLVAARCWHAFEPSD
ncbi:MAG: putative ABC exporter domain-containing protein [Capsulimonadales bacterium]|nr:putative ABC exporter domain-containing protein [Capsulimonadales bacterium]